MHTEKREDPLVELGYEVRDLNTVAIRNATIGFFVFAILSAVLGFGVYRIMNPTVFEPKPLSHRVVPGAPNPLVQSNIAAKTDIMDVRQHETAVLTGPPSWADPAKTHLRIPIDQAMEIIATKGVPATGAEVPAVSKGHTPDPAIGEKPSTAPIKLDPSTVRGGTSPAGSETLKDPTPIGGGIKIDLPPAKASTPASPKKK